MKDDNSNIIPFPAPDDLSALKGMLEYIGEEANRMGVPLVSNFCGSAAMSLDLYTEANGGTTIYRESLSENANNVLAFTRRGDADAKE